MSDGKELAKRRRVRPLFDSNPIARLVVEALGASMVIGLGSTEENVELPPFSFTKQLRPPSVWKVTAENTFDAYDRSLNISDTES